MSDRELLEWAAKAAGKQVIRSRLEDPLNQDFLVANSDRNDHHESGPWNPLTDDGDALRLAVKLGLLISQSAYKCSENAYGFVSIAWYGQRVKFEPERFTDDPYAATRRAIVRAAAEIGRASGEK